MAAKEKIVLASGKRKSAIARASIRAGTGNVRINKVPIENFSNEQCRMRIMEPMMLAGSLGGQVDVDIRVNGGGENGQADAARVAISNALIEFSKDKKLEQAFISYDRQLLVADVRRKETRKPNDSKARAKRQKSYR
ncbi:30S ribosomal protein S9 [Candidatus Woesearchaeota archaeon]|nr:30S ribosomal protein S9 [Candidatus Woesearchaeota archaeon]MBW3016820.1 30S ribosomal protein S9 [Candidatus Woesearchaeota archaeon]